MTDQGLDNCFTDELIASKLLPVLIVTNSPFYCGRINPFKFLYKKIFLLLRYLIKRSLIKRKYQAYFLAKNIQYHAGRLRGSMMMILPG
jgi:hypothetical protein